MPFLQRDVVQLYERKAVLRPTATPSAPDGAPPPRSQSARSARPRSASGRRRGDELEENQNKPVIVGGFAFPPSSSPRPELLAAASAGRRRQPLSVVEATRRKRLGIADPGDADPEDLLPSLTSVNIHTAGNSWFDGAQPTSAPAPAPEGALWPPRSADDDVVSLPPPQRPSSALSDARIPTGTEASGAAGAADGAQPTRLADERPPSPERPRTRGVLEFASVEAVPDLDRTYQP